MTIYISGPITQHPTGNVEAFAAAVLAVESKGHKAINPHDVCSHLIDAHWLDYMRLDIKALMDADAILLLPEWDMSRGSKIEINIFVHLGLPVFESIDEVPAL